jgi:putative flippase GtrA
MTPGLDKLKMKFKDRDWLVREFWQMVRYGIVGGGSTVFFLGLYALFSKVLFRTWNPTLLDALALTVSAVFNFMLHRAWSFKAKGFSVGMIHRYLVTIVSASLLQVALFHVGTAWLGFLDFYVQIVLVPFIAWVQYVGHRMFTFHPRFEKKLIIPEPQSESMISPSSSADSGAT